MIYNHQLKKEEIDEILSYLELQTAQWGHALTQQGVSAGVLFVVGSATVGPQNRGTSFAHHRPVAPFMAL